MARVMVISDPHLSPTHGFFWENWRRAGDEPPGQEADQIIDARRLQRWLSAFGADRFAFALDGWRVIGLNAQLLGSELPQEGEQDAWLDAELARGPQPIMLVLHKPLFEQSSDEAELTATSVNPEPRARLMRRLRAAPVRLVVSGHLHCHRDMVRDGLRYVWAPSPAFQVPAPPEWAAAVPGVLAIEVDGEEVRVELVEVPGLAAYDLAELKGYGRYAYLRDMPPCPPAL